MLLFELFGDDHGLPAILQARRESRLLASRIAELRAENTTLRRRAEALRGDPLAIEAEARAALGLIRPGELVVTAAHGAGAPAAR